MFAPTDLAEPPADQLHIVSGREESNRLLGQLWGAVKAAATLRILADARAPRLTSARDGMPSN